MRHLEFSNSSLEMKKTRLFKNHFCLLCFHSRQKSMIYAVIDFAFFRCQQCHYYALHYIQKLLQYCV